MKFQARLNVSSIKTTTDERMSSVTNGIVMAMTDNAAFPRPTPTLEEISTAEKQFSENNFPRNQCNSDSSDVKNEKKGTLVNKLVSLARYVELTAGDNIDALRSSGFQVVEVEKTTQAPGLPGAPTIFVNGVAGMMVFRVPRDKNATIYEVSVWSDDSAKAKTFSSNNRDIVADGLPAGETLRCQIRLANTAGKGPQSPTYTSRIPLSGELLTLRK